jgi:hypothetical protein
LRQAWTVFNFNRLSCVSGHATANHRGLSRLRASPMTRPGTPITSMIRHVVDDNRCGTDHRPATDRDIAKYSSRSCRSRPAPARPFAAPSNRPRLGGCLLGGGVRVKVVDELHAPWLIKTSSSISTSSQMKLSDEILQFLPMVAFFWISTKLPILVPSPSGYHQVTSTPAPHR